MLSQGMGIKRMSSQSCTHSKTRLQNYPRSTNRIVSHTHNSQRLCKSTKTNVSVGMCAGNASKECHYYGKNECKPGILQHIVSCTQTREKLEASNRLECIKHASFSPNIQNGDGRGDKKLHLQREMGSLGRFDRRVLPHPHISKVIAH